jgi:hypothetical protein
VRVSRYGGGCALVCVIVGGGHLPWVPLLFVFGEGPDGELAVMKVSKLWRWGFVG